MNIWVFAQAADGAVTTGTLELLTKARSLGEVSAFVGGDAAGIAAELGEYGASTVYATGDLGGKLPGVAVAAAMQAVINGGSSPDVIMFPQNYEGRDVMSRLSVKLDRTVITNNIDIAADGGTVSVTTPIFGGNTLVSTAFTGSGPYLAAFRPKSFAAESAGGGGAGRVFAAPPPRSCPHRFPSSVQPARLRCTQCTSRRPRVRSSTRRPWSSRVVADLAKQPSTRWSRRWRSC
jgi:electron transfer flavoprotein alpha subunit